ncbi:MAG: hypothetical protein NC548_29605 [Lachnospiraceae bacterium]|nr:hypothetical protein [Lachnospiraceae bacterium]
MAHESCGLEGSQQKPTKEYTQKYDKECFTVLKNGKEQHMDLIYHGYEAEKAVRKALVERYPRERFQLATKLPLQVSFRSYH